MPSFNPQSAFARDVMLQKYSMVLPDGTKEGWGQIAHRVATNVLSAVGANAELMAEVEGIIARKEFVPGGRYLYAAGRPYHQTGNCIMKRAQDSREGWSEHLRKVSMALMTGAGVGVVYSDVRGRGKPIRKTGGVASGPGALAQMTNEVARWIQQGGSRRAALWAGLHWSHPDVLDFVRMKDWSHEVRALKAKDFNFPAPMDMTNISCILDDDFFAAYDDESHPRHSLANTIYWGCLRRMLKTGEPGFSIDCGPNAGENLRNACTELVSYDDDDVCNLGSINLARINDLEHFNHVLDLAVAFLLAGTVYSDVPYPEVDRVRSANRRLGLGIMGIHEWLLMRGKKYGPDAELDQYLACYATSTERAAKLADVWDLSRPIKTRAMAPNGCQRGDTLVVTDKGILSLDELNDGTGRQWQDLGFGVAQEDHTTKVARRFFVNGKAKTKRILLSSGLEMESTTNHQYRALRGGDYLWVRSDELRAGDLLVVALDTYHNEVEPQFTAVRQTHYNERLPALPNQMTPELAWFLGVFMADGSMHGKGIRIACNANNPQEYNEVADVGSRLLGVEPTVENNGRGCVYVCFSSGVLLRWLYVNALDKPTCNDMVVPPVVRCSSRRSVKAFLDGYWFGDGSRSSGAVYVDTVSRRLAQELVVLYRALGQDSYISSHLSGMGSLMYRVYPVKTRRRCHSSSVEEALAKNGLSSCTVDVVEAIFDSECETFDIEVPETVTYIANGIVSHNTVGIVAETTTCIEPIFCAAYKRRYLKGDVWHSQYVIDPTAERLVKQGISPDSIEDAYALAEDVERRVAFQAHLQKYVDHAISSTINLPRWGSELNNEDRITSFGTMLMKYLPQLRGITCYPDGARGGQPLNPVNFRTALKHLGQSFQEGGEKVLIEGVDVCDISRTGSCG